MNHLDLFSGIGGFALAVDTVWPNSTHTFCDNDLFCQKVLTKHWPNSKIYGDIRTLITDADNDGLFTTKRLEDNKKKPEASKTVEVREIARSTRENCVDILTGGFPCQPFSQAGRRKGTKDDRYLWPEMFRVIQLTKPQWVIAENVFGLITWNDGLVLEQVCADLEREGYQVQPLIIPACGVNAPHRRYRVWIVAHSGNSRQGGKESKSHETSDGLQKKHRKEYSAAREFIGTISDRKVDGYDADSSSEGLERGKQERQGHSRQSDRKRREKGRSWNENWLEVATELCGVDDGLPAELDGLKLTKSGHRRERLKSLGNAIVPQVAIEIMKAIPLTNNK